jgi:hypothetical protein
LTDFLAVGFDPFWIKIPPEAPQTFLIQVDRMLLQLHSLKLILVKNHLVSGYALRQHKSLQEPYHHKSHIKEASNYGCDR